MVPVFFSLDTDVNTGADGMIVPHKCVLTGYNIYNAKASALTVSLRDAANATAGAAAGNKITEVLQAGESLSFEFEANAPVFLNGIYVNSDGDSTSSSITCFIV